MKEKTLYFYRNGYNCSQCLLKAAEAVYRVPLPKAAMDMCSGINTGFGIGGTCSTLIAGIMVFGLLFDEVDAKRMRIKFLNMAMQEYGSLDCCQLKKRRKNGMKCDELIGEIAELVEYIIAEG